MCLLAPSLVPCPALPLQLGLDGLKSATLLSWLKDAGFYALKNVTVEVREGKEAAGLCARTLLSRVELHEAHNTQ